MSIQLSPWYLQTNAEMLFIDYIVRVVTTAFIYIHSIFEVSQLSFINEVLAPP